MSDDRLQKLREANPALDLAPVDDPAFAACGRLLTFFDPQEMIEKAGSILPTSEGVVYEPSVPAIETGGQFSTAIEQQVYGGMPIQVGWCYGRNNRMGGLEYHKGVEVIVCLTDVVLLVGQMQDIVFGYDITYDTANVVAFYAPEGSVIEFASWCLHFAPIQTRADEQFATLVYLPKGTNEPLPYEPDRIGESKLLFGVNKWLIVHPDAHDLIQEGAYVGVIGEDIVVDLP